MEIKKVLVVGAGLMGKQIAMNAAIHGYETVLNDMSDGALNAAEAWMKEYLDGRVAKGKMTTQAAEGVAANIRVERDLTVAAHDADLVIEAIIEEEGPKKALFEQLDQLTKPGAILASNSSFIPSSVVAGSTRKPDKVANLHYFNPALLMELVEDVQGPHTSEDTARTLIDFAVATGKKPIWVRKEIDGFVANRILSKITQEAYFLVESGIVTPQEVDTAVEKGLNHPMGPFRLMDLVGIDIAYRARKRRYELTNDENDRVPRCIEEKFNAGELGRKTGKGFYDYSKK